jgi:tRNA(adenine34) deaminase
VAEWDDLRAPWPEVFSLMWESYVAGTIPVGAVVVDEAGEVVSRGRNRIFDDSRDGSLAGSRLAHAEVNALVALRSGGTYQALTLYSALEPCHLCLSAAMTVGVGSLRYASADPYAGAIGKLLPSADHQAHPALKIEGPLSGLPGQLPELLHVAHFLWRAPDANIMGFYRSTRPDLVAAAQRLPSPDSGATLAQALGALTAGAG